MPRFFGQSIFRKCGYLVRVKVRGDRCGRSRFCPLARLTQKSIYFLVEI
jgi:hypothetical protein